LFGLDALNTRFTLYRYTFDYLPPFAVRSGMLLHLEHQEKQGWGEIAPFPALSRESSAQAQEQLLYALKRMREGKELPSPLFPSVAFGLHTACSYPGEKRVIPLCALLAGSPKDILAKAQMCLRAGYTCAKLKIAGMSPELAIELIRILSSHFLLRIDANRAFTWEEAMRIAAAIQGLNVDYIEEPTHQIDRLEDFPYSFALDESLPEFSRFPENPHFKAIIFKPSVSFGLHLPQDKLRILSSACETGVGIAGIAALSSSASPVGVDTYRFLPRDVLSSPLDFSQGVLHLPDALCVNTDGLEVIAHG
jgi:O-succinylbenzoate synthase